MASISVIIPAYNRSALVSHAIRSALAQTVTPLEVLVVDDGSTDSTSSVVESFGPPVRCLRQQNGGVSKARNTGMRESRGNYIALLDADDLWEPEFLEVQLAALEATNHTGFAIAAPRLVDGDGRLLPDASGFAAATPVFHDVGLTPEAHFSGWLRDKEVNVAGTSYKVFHGDLYEMLFLGNFVVPSGVLMHRGIFEDTRGFDEGFRYAEETEFFHRVAARYPAAVVPVPLFRRRTGDKQSLTASSNTIKLVQNALVSLDRAFALRQPPTAGARSAYTEGRARLVKRLAYSHLTVLDPRGARQALREGWHRGVAPSLAGVGLFAAACLPPFALAGLHRIKKSLGR